MLRIITIPFNESQKKFDNSILEKLDTYHIEKYKSEFFNIQDKCYWTIMVDMNNAVNLKRKSRSYQEFQKEYSKEDQLLLEKLKEWRKKAAESGGVPVYIIATNAELHEIIQSKPQTLTSLQVIKGFGDKKVEKYGKDIIFIIQDFKP